MSSDWKPEGYSTVSAYLVVEGAQRVIDFLKKIFGATDLRHFPTADGKILHAEVRIGDTVVMIADAGGDYPAFPVWLHVKCARRGRRSLHERARREFYFFDARRGSGWRQCRCDCCCGSEWWRFGSRRPR